MSLPDALHAAAVARAILFANHVLTQSRAGAERLRPHAGRTLRVEVMEWPEALPPWPPVSLRITPAGLLEATPDAAADLTLQLSAGDPLQSLRKFAAGERPAVAITGDAGFAADLSWILDHVRWDAAADAERWFGPVPAAVLEGLGSNLKAQLHRWRSSMPAADDGERP